MERLAPAARRPSHADADADLVAALRIGDERAFVTLVGRYQAALLRLAATFVRDRAVAEEVVQETWLAVLGGIDRFEGRSSLKTWIFQILANRATHARRARAPQRAVLALAGAEDTDDASSTPIGSSPRGTAGSATGPPPERGRARGAGPRRRGDAVRARGHRAAAGPPGRGPRCETWRAGTPRRSAMPSASPTATSASSCTARRGKVRAALEQYLGEGAPS